jgi:hypothetical protein
MLKLEGVVELSTKKAVLALKGYILKSSCTAFYLKYIYTEILMTKPRKRQGVHIQQSNMKKRQLWKQILEKNSKAKISLTHWSPKFALLYKKPIKL